MLCKKSFVVVVAPSVILVDASRKVFTEYTIEKWNFIKRRHLLDQAISYSADKV